MFASPEVRELPADNEIDLVELLRAEGLLEVSRGSASEGIPGAQKMGLKSELPYDWLRSSPP